MKRNFVTLSSVLLCSIVGCSTPNLKDEGSGAQLGFQVRIERPASPPDSAHKDNPLAHMWLIPVPSGVYGAPVGKSLVDVYAHDGERFQVSQRTLESGLAAAAKASKPFLVTYDPVETRIARLGTVTMDSNSSISGQSGLRDPVSGRTLILIYADGACLIRGPQMNVAIPGRGLHWLEVLDSAGASGAWNAVAHPFELRGAPTDVIFRITETRKP